MRRILAALAICLIATSQVFAVSTIELESKMAPIEAEINAEIEEAKAEAKDRTYPVGSLYTTTEDLDASDMHDKFGGSWKRITNTFLWADTYAEVGSTGGQAEYELSAMFGGDADDELMFLPSPYSMQTSSFTLQGLNGFSQGTLRGSVPVTEMGSSQRSIRFMPPYLAVRMFRRVS